MLRARTDLHGPLHPAKRLRAHGAQCPPRGHHQRDGRGKVFRRPVLQQRLLRQSARACRLRCTAAVVVLVKSQDAKAAEYRKHSNTLTAPLHQFTVAS